MTPMLSFRHLRRCLVEPLETRELLSDGVDVPTVTVRAPTSTAVEGGSPGTFRLKRTGEHLGRTLTVKLNWTGSAGSKDVRPRLTTLVFAKNARTLDVSVVPIDDAVDEPTETATVTLAPNGQPWRIGSPRTASVLIDGSETPPPAPPGFTDISWSQAPSPPVVYSETTSAVVDNKLYAFGGYDASFTSHKDVYRFDGTTWTRLADAPVALTNVADAEVGDKVYFAGGYIGNDDGSKTFGTTQVLVYDTTSDTWSDGPALPEALASGELALVGRTLFHFGGETLNRTADVSTTLALDLDNLVAGWTTRTSMRLPLNRVATAVVGGKVYVLGGQTGFDANLVATADIQIYDPASDAWTISPQQLPDARSHTAQSTVFHDGRIVMVVGENAHNHPQTNVWSIDPATQVTSVLASFPDVRSSAAGGIVDGKLYVFGGYRGVIPQASYVGTFL